MGTRVVCFGELLLRMGAPGRQLLLQSPTLEVCVGGAEANVAVGMRHFGHESAMVGLVADNALGEAAAGELRRHGVDTGYVQRQDGRMGLYFLTTGALQRPSEVLYDRADSAFARAGGGSHDWNAILQGADWLHVSGITPALGQQAAANTLAAMQAARALGVKVAFDGNYRPKLWESWAGRPRETLFALMQQADLLFANHRDMEVVLGESFEQATSEARFTAAAERAFQAFPQLGQMAATVRHQSSVDHQQLGAISVLRDGTVVQAPAWELAAVVDRIGTGDAFAAGVLHGRLTGMAAADGLRFGLAAACLKHSIPGDLCLVRKSDVEALLGESALDVRR